MEKRKRWQEKLVRWRSKQRLARGPKIVALGGGSGLSTLLRGLKEVTSNLTAIVTMGDDGGSSGRLRKELGVLPPGDIRNCLVALADKEETMASLFSYRFEKGALRGHSLGNLLLAGLEEQFGDFRKGVEQVSKVFALRGKVFPATLENMTLQAHFADGRIVTGETALRDTPGKIRRLEVMPENCAPLTEALLAVEEADLIVLGPGSLYTSVLPNLLITGLQEALRSSPAPCLYVCNIMTEQGETDDFTVSDHLRALEEHCGPGLIDAVLAAKEEFRQDVLSAYSLEGAVPVRQDEPEVRRMGIMYYESRFYDGEDVVRHNPAKLAKTILEVFAQLPWQESVEKRCSFIGGK